MFEQPMWRTFLARLAAVCEVPFAGLVLTPPHAAHGLVLAHGDAPAGAIEAVDTSGTALRENRSYAASEFEGAIAGDLRAVRVREESGIDAVLTVAGPGALPAAAGSLLAALAPHLRVALRVFAALERERARSVMSDDAVRRMNFGWIAIDGKCRIVDLDPQAERVLQQSGLLRCGSYDRLTPANPAVDRELTALARRFAASPDERPRAINLSHDPWIDLLVSPLRVDTLSGGSQAVAAVYLRGDRTSLADRHEQLADLFQLTPSEARLAWSMAQGMSISEAAAAHGLTIETARNYSKKIYAKTGARGQADLVRHILTSVLALA
ncbi:helix-turn-helix transcriptional regulator [Altererythrobacter salegens]|uniref:Helix-turn-helix transcriptional regulator n=1 Tax=Croceibacterium salegens TaxID=1737568 RepID=A0A6I4SY64_9SPHN|nr:helix-turn-helix transcriptional regulator [Croceibacterium salegens]